MSAAHGKELPRPAALINEKFFPGSTNRKRPLDWAKVREKANRYLEEKQERLEKLKNFYEKRKQRVAMLKESSEKRQ